MWYLIALFMLFVVMSAFDIRVNYLVALYNKIKLAITIERKKQTKPVADESEDFSLSAMFGRPIDFSGRLKLEQDQQDLAAFVNDMPKCEGYDCFICQDCEYEFESEEEVPKECPSCGSSEIAPDGGW